MEDQKFDDLTKALASRMSRRQILKGAGGLFAAVGLGSLVPARALADGGGNSDCAHFCNAVFPPGDERGHCKSDAAHGKGPCATCGPAAPKGHPDICGTGTSGAACCPAATPTCCGNATCVNLQSDTGNCGACGVNCGAGETCVAGTCMCGTGAACTGGRTCAGGTCAYTCTNSSGPGNPAATTPSCDNPKAPSGNCYCVMTTTGTQECVQGGRYVLSCEACVSGEICYPITNNPSQGTFGCSTPC